MGDAQLSAEEAVYNFDMYRFYRKYLDDIKDAQLEDGSLSDVIPAYWKRYPADPAWGTAYIVLAWTLYWYYGDEEILNEHFDSMRKYVDFLRSRAEDHILLDLGKYGDWCPPGCIFPKRTPLNLVSTWYYYHDTLFLSRMAGVIGREEDAAEYRKLAGDIKQAFNAQYLTDNGYEYLKMSPIDHIPGQTSNVLPLYLDMAEGKDRELAEAKLMDTVIQHYDYHFDTGIVGTRYILEVLTKLGRGDAAFKMVTRKGFPGFEYMLREGATTLWERWEKLEGPGMNSHNHIMLGSVDAWFYRGILGIIPAEPAWKTIRLTPVFPEELIWAGGSVDTVQGKVSLSWEREDQKLKIKIIIPPGTKGLYSFAGRENRELLPGFHYIEETTEK
jgi:alpha-L-rhamnosidase